MPIRLLKAVFGYLNFFTMVYGKEPLRSAGGPRTPELDQDLGKVWLHGRMIELSKVKNDPQYGGNLVPGNWELIRVERAGAHAEVLARTWPASTCAPTAPSSTPTASTSSSSTAATARAWRARSRSPS